MKIIKLILTLLLIFSFEITFSQESDSLNISPNPFSSSTTIYFEISQTDTVSLKILSMAGQTVKSFYDLAILQSGSYNIKLNGDSLKNDMYIISLQIIGAKKKISKRFYKNDLLTDLESNDTSTMNLLLFPNPTNDLVKIPYDGNKVILIKNQKGQTVKTFTTSQSTISISDLEKGQYFITISTDKNEIITTQKIIKKD